MFGKILGTGTVMKEALIAAVFVEAKRLPIRTTSALYSASDKPKVVN